MPHLEVDDRVTHGHQGPDLGVGGALHVPVVEEVQLRRRDFIVLQI